MTNVPPVAASDSAVAERWFHRALLVTVLVKLVLAATVPFTTDEAYFVVWGRHLDYGYYDHGAMTGWWLWLMLHVSAAAWWLRLPAVLVSQFTGWMLWRTLLPVDRTKAAWAATLYLVSPINLFNVLITTDTPLLFFSTVAVWFAWRGVRRENPGDYFAAGLALGFAFLSKYFAVLLGLSFAVLLLACLGRPRGRALAVLLAGIIPGVGINIAWNYHHWWANVLFNLVTRQASSGLSLLPPLLFLGLLVVFAGPGVIVACVRPGRRDRLPWRDAWIAARTDGTMVLLVAFALPHAIFLLVAFSHEIGAHWILSFFPFLAAVLFVRFGAESLRRMARSTIVYSAAIPVIALVFALTPPGQALLQNNAFSIALAVKPREVLAELAPYRPRYQLTTPSYAKSALLGYYDGTNVPVLGIGSYHARQDDMLTDFRQFDGRNLMLVTDDERNIEPYRAWFAHSEIREQTIHGVPFLVLLGDGFNYSLYREQVLQKIANRYYRMPGWLRPWSTPCFFFERYNLQPESAR